MEPLGTPEALDRAPARSTVAEAPAPAAPHEPLLPERSDDRGSEASFTASSARSFDTLDDLLSRFTLDFKPEYTLKLRHRLGPLIVGADVTHTPELGAGATALVVKPADRGAWWRRARADSRGALTLRSRRLPLFGVLVLDLAARVAPLAPAGEPRWGAEWRVATRWDALRGEARNKKRLALGPATEGRVHWSVSYDLPHLAGAIGGAGRAARRAVEADVGYAHAEIPKLELVVWPGRRAAGEGASGEKGAARPVAAAPARASSEGGEPGEPAAAPARSPAAAPLPAFLTDLPPEEPAPRGADGAGRRRRPKGPLDELARRAQDLAAVLRRAM